jgi:hypothetical protein
MYMYDDRQLFNEHAPQKHGASMHEEASRLYDTKCSEAIIQFLRMLYFYF